MTSATAPGKIILFGEHAVVYGRPALAAPLGELRARARVEARRERGVVIHARDLNRTYRLDSAPEEDPLAAIIRAVLAELHAEGSLGLDVWIDSDIPIASGLGSGAAVSTALVRALSAHLGQPLGSDLVSDLVFQAEKLYHGTPSGIDNSVIAFERPVRFTKQAGAQPIRIARPFVLAIANTGIASPTKITVGDVRRGWQRDPIRYEHVFDGIAEVVNRAQLVLALGHNGELGELMNRNQELLRLLDVSSQELELLIRTGIDAGAEGAKLSGGGRGGNALFYVQPGRAEAVEAALMAAGATGVLVTTLQSA